MPARGVAAIAPRAIYSPWGAIDPQVAADAVRRIAAAYSIRTVMTFGGEPLLYPDIVASVMCAAREVGVERRQVITNGCFTRDSDRIRTMCGASRSRLMGMFLATMYIAGILWKSFRGIFCEGLTV